MGKDAKEEKINGKSDVFFGSIYLLRGAMLPYLDFSSLPGFSRVNKKLAPLAAEAIRDRAKFDKDFRNEMLPLINLQAYLKESIGWSVHHRSILEEDLEAKGKFPPIDRRPDIEARKHDLVRNLESIDNTKKDALLKKIEESEYHEQYLSSFKERVREFRKFFQRKKWLSIALTLAIAIFVFFFITAIPFFYGLPFTNLDIIAMVLEYVSGVVILTNRLYDFGEFSRIFILMLSNLCLLSLCICTIFVTPTFSTFVALCIGLLFAVYNLIFIDAEYQFDVEVLGSRFLLFNRVLSNLMLILATILFAFQGLWLISIAVTAMYLTVSLLAIISYRATRDLNANGAAFSEYFKSISDYIFSEPAKVEAYLEERVKLPPHVPTQDFLGSLISSYFLLLYYNGYGYHSFEKPLVRNSYYSVQREIPKKLFLDVITMINATIANFERDHDQSTFSEELKKIINKYRDSVLIFRRVFNLQELEQLEENEAKQESKENLNPTISRQNTGRRRPYVTMVQNPRSNGVRYVIDMANQDQLIVFNMP